MFKCWARGDPAPLIKFDYQRLTVYLCGSAGSNPHPEVAMSVTPYVMVDSAKVFGEFLRSTFDAELRNVVSLPSDPQRVIHAEARLADGEIFFADSGADGGRCLRSPTEPVHVQLFTIVPDPERTHRQAVAAGARSAMEVAAQEDGSRMGGFVDPFGTLWWVTDTAPA